MNQQNQEKEKEIVYIEREKIVYVVKEESELSKTVDRTIKGTASITVNLYYIILLFLSTIILITISFGLLHFLFIDANDSPTWGWYIKYFTGKEFFQVI